MYLKEEAVLRVFIEVCELTTGKRVVIAVLRVATRKVLLLFEAEVI